MSAALGHALKVLTMCVIWSTSCHCPARSHEHFWEVMPALGKVSEVQVSIHDS